MIEATSFLALFLSYSWKRQRPLIVTRVSTTMEDCIASEKEAMTKKEKVLCWLEHEAIKRGDYLVTHTRAHRERVSRRLEIPQERFKIIPLGIDLYGGGERNAENSNCDEVKVLYVGRFEPRKGVDVLLKAIPLVLKQFEHIHFTLAGYGDRKGKYENNFKNNGGQILMRRVTFRGAVDEETLKTLYKECDIFVAPSRYESFGLIYVEAMRHAKPVIGCDTGGVPEVVIDGETGFLARPGDAEDLAEKIVKLAKSKDIRDAMGRAGFDRAHALFSKERMVENTIEFYKEIVSQSKGSQHDNGKY